MKTGVDIVLQMGLLKLKPHTIIPVEDVGNHPDSKVVVIATGSQGEEFAAIMRISNKTHKHIKMKKGDTVLLSSSVIPGNELGVQKVKDNLSRQGARIIHYKISEIHASGHANADELLWMHKKIKSKFFMPIHGYHYMLSVHGDIARAAGTADENIILPDNGSIVEIYDNGTKIRVLKEKAPATIVMVDGFSIGDMQDVVIRDRQMLAQDGMFVIVATVDGQTGKLRKSPDIISRGFVYLKESQDLLHESRQIIKKTVEDSSSHMHPINIEYVKNLVGENLSKFLFQKTAKRPLVIPVLLSM
jgi:ribonuclease J